MLIHCGKYIIEYCDQNTITPHGLTTYYDILVFALIYDCLII